MDTAILLPIVDCNDWSRVVGVFAEIWIEVANIVSTERG